MHFVFTYSFVYIFSYFPFLFITTRMIQYLSNADRVALYGGGWGNYIVFDYSIKEQNTYITTRSTRLANAFM